MSGYPLTWTRVTALTVLLIPLSWLYRIVVAARRTLYAAGMLRSVRLPVPVIAVGNISVGGTGKTPLVLWLVERLRAAGFVPGIVSRGYISSGVASRSGGEPRAVGVKDDAAQCGDEPVLLARRSACPVWIGANRVAVARALLAAHPQCTVIVSDDGLQHYALARDAEVAVVDGARGHGNGLLLPAGPLREPPSRLHKVDAVVIRDGDAPADSARVLEAPRFAMSMTAGAFYRLRDPQHTEDVSGFRRQRVHAAAGIGNPDHFFNTLKALGLAFTPHTFPDHHPYAQGDLDFADCDAVVMTEKDAVKYEQYAAAAPEKYWALGVAAKVESGLAPLLIKRLHERQKSR